MRRSAGGDVRAVLRSNTRPVRVALVHEWLDTYAGSECVLEQLIVMYPDADLFATVDFLPQGQRGFLQGKVPHTTFIQRLPFARRHFRAYLGLMPLAVEQHDLSGYNLVISNNHALSKGVLTGPDTLHISYINSPIRYAWDLQHRTSVKLSWSGGRAALCALAIVEIASVGRTDSAWRQRFCIELPIYIAAHPEMLSARERGGAASG